MVNYDFTPFYRSTIGFERMVRALENTARLAEADNGFPPYNIEAIGEDQYRLTFAVAGFSRDDLEIEVRENTLYVSGRTKPEDGDAHYLHRGIAGRGFKKQLRLADHVQVENAWLENGLLTIDLVRELPEEKKPRTIEISTSTPKKIQSKTRSMLGASKKAA